METSVSNSSTFQEPGAAGEAEPRERSWERRDLKQKGSQKLNDSDNVQGDIENKDTEGGKKCLWTVLVVFQHK